MQGHGDGPELDIDSSLGLQFEKDSNWFRSAVFGQKQFDVFLCQVVARIEEIDSFGRRRHPAAFIQVRVFAEPEVGRSLKIDEARASVRQLKRRCESDKFLLRNSNLQALPENGDVA